MSNYQAYGVTKAGLSIEELTLAQRELKPTEVLLQVMYCGVCASDIHQMTADWAGHGVNLFNTSPHIVPGHEAVSCVIGYGAEAAADFKIGDIVLCGPQRSCECYEKKIQPLCSCCQKGSEQLCMNGIGKLYNGKETGGLGQIMTCSKEFCFKAPAGLKLELAGPLACAGLTTFTPLFERQLPAGSDVICLGIGGLGLMAIQYCVALGYNVTAFTTSKASKEKQLLELGVKHVVDYKAEDLAPLMGKHDLIMNTVSAPIDPTMMLKLLKPNGELIYLGLGNDNIVINPFALVGTSKKVSGSFIGGTASFKAMLDFSMEKNIYPICEVVKAPFHQNNANYVAEQITRVHEGKVRYRLVLDYDVNYEQIVADAKKAQEAKME